MDLRVCFADGPEDGLNPYVFPLAILIVKGSLVCIRPTLFGNVVGMARLVRWQHSLSGVAVRYGQPCRLGFPSSLSLGEISLLASKFTEFVAVIMEEIILADNSKGSRPKTHISLERRVNEC